MKAKKRPHSPLCINPSGTGKFPAALAADGSLYFTGRRAELLAFLLPQHLLLGEAQ